MRRLILLITFTICLNVYANEIANLNQKCNANDGFSCVNIGFIYYDGIGVNQDYAKAVEYFDKACDLNSGINSGIGCGVLGAMYYDGTGVSQNKNKALEYYSKACDLKARLGCAFLREIEKQN